MAGSHEAKRGRLRRVSIDHLYDEDGAPSGHMVTAEHEPDRSSGKEFGGYPADIRTAHETHESALAKVKEHHADNLAKFGRKKKGPPVAAPMDESFVRGAMARNK